MTATTVRLPDELGDRLAQYCEDTGAVRNRVIALALRSYLGDAGTPPLPAREQIVLDDLRRELDAREVEER